MRLRVDDNVGIPGLTYHDLVGGHKLRFFCTRTGYERQLRALGNRLEEDLNNIDQFVKRWHEKHDLRIVDLMSKIVE